MLEKLWLHREWPTVTVISNSTDLIGWDPAFVSADWFTFETWFGHVLLSVAKVLLPLICFKPLLLENGKRYDKKAFE